MCVIYLLSENVTAHKSYGRIVLYQGDKKLQSVPLQELTQVVVSKRAHLSTPLLFELLAREVQVSFVDWQGKVVGTVGGEQETLQRLFQQKECFADVSSALTLIKQVACAKLYGQAKVMRRYAKNQHNPALTELAAYLRQAGHRLTEATDAEQVRGIEGEAAKRYFQAFAQVLDGSLWPWPGRQQHPAYEPVNALLNYGYAFLEREVRLAIVGSGLDCRLGFFHSNNGRKDSLVYDVMETYRALVIDRFVLKCLNYGTFKPTDFTCTEEGCIIGEAARRVWCQYYEAYMEKPAHLLAGQTPRNYIRESIARFSRQVFHTEQEQTA